MRSIMSNKKASRIMVAILILLFAAPISAKAWTVNFDVTIPGDVWSVRTAKDDSEQKFYVTGVTFSKNGELTCTSHSLVNVLVNSDPVVISKNNKKGNGGYIGYARSGEYFFMGTTSNLHNFRVTGRYTP